MIISLLALDSISYLPRLIPRPTSLVFLNPTTSILTISFYFTL